MIQDPNLDYRALLRRRIADLKAQGTRFKTKELAERIGVQYTFLSRALNQEGTHLNDDHLFELCNILEFFPEEIEFVLLLKQREQAQSKARIAHIDARIKDHQRSRVISAEKRDQTPMQSQPELLYLLDPLAVLVHASLKVDKLRNNPRMFCDILGIDIERLEGIFSILEQADFIERVPRSLKIKSVKKSRLHFSTTHPLMRSHQVLLKTQSLAQLQRLREPHKHSLMASFCADESYFSDIKKMFDEFLSKAQKRAIDSKPERVYQLNFDFFHWFTG
jgi:hypothetical protein